MGNSPSQLAVGAIGLDAIMTTSLMDDYKDTINLRKDPKEILEKIKERSYSENGDSSNLGDIITLTDKMKERHLKRIEEISQKKRELISELGRSNLMDMGKGVNNFLDNVEGDIKEKAEERKRQKSKRQEEFEEFKQEQVNDFREKASNLMGMIKEDIRNIGKGNRKSNLRMRIETLQEKIDEIVID